jgi:uncharacterized membrane protein
MELDKNEWKSVNKAIKGWEEEGVISKEEGSRLRKAVDLKRTDNQQIAQYFFLTALSCILLAFGAIFIDDKILERLKVYFALSNIVIAVLAAGVSVLWFWYVRKKQPKLSRTAYEIYLVVGALTSLIALTYICKETGFGGKYSGFLFAVAILLFTLSLLFKSRFLWIAGILGFMGFYGAVTALYSVQDRFLGMNYPIRFTIFGLLVIGLSYLQGKFKPIEDTSRITFIAGMIIFFTGMWGVSVFGNYSDMNTWAQVRQVQVIAYGILFATAAGLSFYLGIKYKDDIARDFGIFFLLVNLYSRYFEFFWDNMNKGVFFLVLAVSFYGVGRWLEKYKGKRKRVDKLKG